MAKTPTMLDLPPRQWQAAYASMTNTARLALEARAEAVMASASAARDNDTAITAARVAAYIASRMASGTHERAVIAQNHAARNMRYTLGYRYLDDVIIF